MQSRESVPHSWRSVVTICALLAVLACGQVSAALIFDEPFTGGFTPPGWQLLGNASTPSGCLQLNPNAQFQAGSAFYKGSTFSSTHFVLTAEINVTGSPGAMADGMTFS